MVENQNADDKDMINTKVQITPSGQAVVTIPQAIVRAMGIMKGDEFLVQFNKNGNIELVRVQ